MISRPSLTGKPPKVMGWSNLTPTNLGTYSARVRTALSLVSHSSGGAISMDF